MVFGHKRGEGYLWDSLVVIWDLSDCLALYDGYLGNIYGFFYADVIGGNPTVSDLYLVFTCFNPNMVSVFFCCCMLRLT